MAEEFTRPIRLMNFVSEDQVFQILINLKL